MEKLKVEKELFIRGFRSKYKNADVLKIKNLSIFEFNKLYKKLEFYFEKKIEKIIDYCPKTNLYQIIKNGLIIANCSLNCLAKTLEKTMKKKKKFIYKIFSLICLKKNNLGIKELIDKNQKEFNRSLKKIISK